MSGKTKAMRTDGLLGGVVGALVVVPLLAGGTSAGAVIANPVRAGADPQIAVHEGKYHLVLSEDDGISLYVSPTLAGLARGERVRVHEAPARGMRSRDIWAPELHKLGERWYIYYAADDGHNENHRMYVLESRGNEPTGPYEFKGKVADPEADRWAIDGTVLAWEGKLYFVWSGWEGTRNGQQNLYIAPMANPWTISGRRVCISRPDQGWEKRSGAWPCYVNEAPAALVHGGRAFLAYSANGFWSEDYCVGLLTLEGKDPLKTEAWHKSKGPVFAKSDEAFNVGHNSFFQSPDGREWWMAYHAVGYPGSGGRDRMVRVGRIGFDAAGMPVFGRPVDKVEAPSGEGEKLAGRAVPVGG